MHLLLCHTWTGHRTLSLELEVQDGRLERETCSDPVASIAPSTQVRLHEGNRLSAKKGEAVITSSFC